MMSCLVDMQKTNREPGHELDRSVEEKLTVEKSAPRQQLLVIILLPYSTSTSARHHILKADEGDRRTTTDEQSTAVWVVAYSGGRGVPELETAGIAESKIS
jgi:hypothetical protein